MIRIGLLPAADPGSERKSGVSQSGLFGGWLD